LVLRHPVTVARSLTRRELTLEQGLALWEYQARAAAAQLAGMHVMVVTFEAALQEPERHAEMFAAWVRHLFGSPVDTRAVKRAARSLDAGVPQHIDPDAASDDLMSPSQRELYESLLASCGVHADWQWAG
jgi:hypothetical protein